MRSVAQFDLELGSVRSLNGVVEFQRAPGAFEDDPHLSWKSLPVQVECFLGLGCRLDAKV